MRKEIIVPLIGLTPFVTLIVGFVMAVFGYEISQFLADFGISTHFGVTDTGKTIVGLSMTALIVAGLFGQAINDRDARHGR
jgi:hypothetical protein